MSIDVALVDQARSDLDVARSNFSRVACCLYHLHQCWEKAFKADYLNTVRRISWNVEPTPAEFETALKSLGHYLPTSGSLRTSIYRTLSAHLHVPLPGIVGAYQQVDSNALYLARATSEFFRSLEQNSLRYPVHLRGIGWVAPGSIPDNAPHIEVAFLRGGEWFRAGSAASPQTDQGGIYPDLTMRKIEDEVYVYLCDVEQRVKSP